VADYYLVERAKGPAWDHSRGRREQDGWDAHAAFMDALAEESFVVLGGPIGEGRAMERTPYSSSLRRARPRSVRASPTTPGRTTCWSSRA
jgi:hypothetical protein